MRSLLLVFTFVAPAALVSLGCQVRTPALDRVLEQYPDLGSGIYETLGRWEEVLGEPETVPQADGAQTFFYWPQHGIAVFTHPLYQGQAVRRPVEERTVTSVIVALRSSFHPSFLPVADDVTIHFDRLLEMPRPRERMPARGASEATEKDSHRDLVASPFRKTVERLHLVAGKPVALEIRDDWWWSHYD